LLDRLRDHAHEVLPAAGIELDFEAEPALTTITLSLASRQALYVIYKEALHNVVKHAQAKLVQVRLRLRQQQLELEVQDDGRGMADLPRPGGQGLANMRMRALAMGGTVALEAARPGTRLLVRLPLR
jgi:signal transduction histidine kinase